MSNTYNINRILNFFPLFLALKTIANNKNPQLVVHCQAEIAIFVSSHDNSLISSGIPSPDYLRQITP
jgi:hypothetical protein